MQQNATAFYESWPAKMNAMKAMPGGVEIGKAFGPFFQGLMKDATSDGGLSVKQKELIALGIGVASRCEPCIYAHVEKCLKAGAMPRFFEADDLPAGGSWQSLTAWSKALSQTRRTVEHPFNAGLMQEALVSQAQLALNLKS